MTETELQMCMDKIAGLWPGMRMTVALTEAWRVMLRPNQYQAVIDAVDEHWRDATDKYAPDQKKVRELVRVHTREYFSPEQGETASRYFAMSDVGKARADRDWHELRAKQEQDEQKQRWHEKVAKVAAYKAARLHRVNQNRQPLRVPTIEQMNQLYKCCIQRGATA